MKKMLKKIMVLVVAATLFVMPAGTALASAPVPILVEENNVIYEFQPEAFYLAGGGNNSFFLDTYYGSPSGEWYVPAGMRFVFQFLTLEANTLVQITTYKNGVQYQSFTASSSINGYMFEFPPESSNNYWRFKVTAITDTSIRLYAGTARVPF